MSDALALCLAGRIAPHIALARMVLDGLSPDVIAPMLPAGTAIAALFAVQRGRLDVLAAMLRDSGTDHAEHDVDAIAAMFDRAVALAPEASVAAYSLGDAGLLAAASAEIVDWLVDRRLAGADADVLDLGCGIGRIAAALAPRVRSILGLDVSAGMVAEARRRHARPGLRFLVTDGQPPRLDAASLDLALVVDAMPYLVLAGLAAGHVAGLRHGLRAGGHLVVLNWSYRRDDAADRAEAAALAEECGFDLLSAGERPFSMWDGTAYIFAVPA